MKTFARRFLVATAITVTLTGSAVAIPREGPPDRPWTRFVKMVKLVFAALPLDELGTPKP